MSEVVCYRICHLCDQPIFDLHDAYEVQVTYLGWKERTDKGVVCVSCFEDTEAGKIFNRATYYVTDRRFKPPPYRLRKVLTWYIQDKIRDMIQRMIRKSKSKSRSVPALCV